MRVKTLIRLWSQQTWPNNPARIGRTLNRGGPMRLREICVATVAGMAVIAFACSASARGHGGGGGRGGHAGAFHGAGGFHSGGFHGGHGWRGGGVGYARSGWSGHGWNHGWHGNGRGWYGRGYGYGYGYGGFTIAFGGWPYWDYPYGYYP